MLKELRGYKCTDCGCFLNVSKETYNEHRERYHGHKYQPPKKMTPEEKATIVKRVEESWLAPFLIDGTKGVAKVEKLVKTVDEHRHDCKCTVCFNVKLDAILANTEVALASSTQTIEIKESKIELQLGNVQWQG